jgi:hypothetical protein
MLTVPLLLDEDGDTFTGLNDADDWRADIHPDAPEFCDGVDNNQDGVVDEDAAYDVHMWYADMDGDGQGDPAHVVYACNPPLGYVRNHDDVNDVVPYGWHVPCHTPFGCCDVPPWILRRPFLTIMAVR